MNITNLLLRAVRASPESPAVSSGDRVRLRYVRLWRRVTALAAQMRETLDLRPGDRVALAMTNCPQYVELWFAAWHAGLVAVPINAKLHPRELEFILGNAGARLCFVTAELAGPVDGLRATLPALDRVIDVGSAEYRNLAGGDSSIDMHPSNPDDVAWMFYTSGTTGRPKGVMITHRNLMSATLSYFAAVDSIAPGDSVLHAAPMSHGSGMYNFPHVLVGANQVIPESGYFDAAETFALCETWRGVTMFAAPTMVNRLVAHVRAHAPALDGLKTIVYGGGPMYLQDIRDALAVMGPRFVQIYGQGEAPMTITSLPRHYLNDSAHPRYEQRLASVGMAQPSVEVRVADGDDRTLPAGEIGEVLVRGDVVMRGYWENPQASAEALRNGWLHTGDVGSFDEDGFLTLRDRSKDLIITGGSNVYPREVEEVLLRHPAVSEVSVVGKPSQEWGEEVIAFVVARNAEQVDSRELDALCLDHIARFKRPKAYRFLAELPKNHYGKVLKTALREMLDKE